MPVRKETVLAYKADARGLRDLSREIKKAFDPGTAKELNRQFKDLQGSLKKLTAEQIMLNREMSKAKEGTKAYESLEKTLGKVEKRMRQVRSAVQGAGGGGADPAKGAFGQGFMQGIAPGVSSFTQRGPGMRAQVAGQMIGGGVRGIGRNIGGAMTGGGVGALLQGVPFLGGLASMAGGAVGSAAQNQKAALAGIMTAGGAGFAGISRARSRAEAGVGIPAISQARIAAAGSRGATDERGRISARGLRGRTMSVMGGGSGSMPPSYAQQDAVAGAFRGAGAFGPGGSNPFSGFSTGLGRSNAAGSMATNESQNRDADDIRAARLAAEGAELTRQQGEVAAAKQRRSARGRAAARKAARAPFAGAISAGKFLGMSETESITMATQMGSQIGGGIPGASQMQGVLGAQLQGVDQGTSARLMRQMRPGRGGMTTAAGGQANAIASAIGQAVALGLEGSEINDHLSLMATLQEQAEAKGVKISSEGIGTMARGFGALGLSGPQAGRLTSQLGGFGQRVAAQGASSPQNIALLRAAGFQPGQGADNYVSALEGVESFGQGGLGPKQMFKFLQNMVGGVKGDSERKLVLKRSLGAAGMDVGFGQAGTIARSLAGGEGQFSAMLNETSIGRRLANGKEASAEQMQNILAGGDVKGMTGILRGQAAVADQLLAAGRKIAPLVQGLDRQAAKLAEGVGHLLEPVTQFLPMMDSLTSAINGLNKWLGDKGGEALEGNIGKDIIIGNGK